MSASDRGFAGRVHRGCLRALVACASALALLGRDARAEDPAAAPPAATATPSAADTQEANLRFQEGKALLEQGAIVEACAKLAQSLALHRRGGTLLNLATCKQRQGHHATAVRLFQEAFDVASAEGRTDRMELAQLGMVESRGLLSWVVITLSAGSKAPGLVVTLDGEKVDVVDQGSMIAVDPGTHAITAAAPGRKPFEASVTSVGTGDRRKVEVPALAPAAAGTGAAASPTTAPTAPFGQADRSMALRIVGYGALGAGGLATVIGAVFGGKAIADSAESRRLCPDDVCPTAPGLEKNRSAREAAAAANVLISTGLAVAAVGAVVLVLAPPLPAAQATPPRVSASAWATPSGGGLIIGGQW